MRVSGKYRVAAALAGVVIAVGCGSPEAIRGTATPYIPDGGKLNLATIKDWCEVLTPEFISTLSTESWEYAHEYDSRNACSVSWGGSMTSILSNRDEEFWASKNTNMVENIADKEVNIQEANMPSSDMSGCFFIIKYHTSNVIVLNMEDSSSNDEMCKRSRAMTTAIIPFVDKIGEY